MIIADRTVMVRLLANVQGFTAGMSQAQAATTRLGTDFRNESETVGRGLTGLGLAAGAGVGVAVAKFAEFDQAMSYVQASTHESASNMNLLRDAAVEAGASTVFSATESANAIEELAKAGITTADIMDGGLAGSLDLAAAGGLGVADAATIAATALTQFKLSGSEVPHIADLLAAGAGKAQGSVEDLAAALNQGGLVAAQTGLTIEETTGTLAAFASAGLLGSDAGTSFKTMLQRLTPQSAEAREKMEELGISAYDAQGQFIGMEQFAGVLRNGLKDLTPEARNAALGVMFGSDAVRAASVVYEQGAEGIGDWISKVDDTGYAAETAAMRLDNLAGDIEKLGGAFDTAFIQAGSGANDVLRNMVQVATGLVDAYGGLPLPIQQGVLVLGALVAVVGLAGGAFLLAVPKIVEFRVALATLNTAFPAVGNAARGVAGFLTGPWGIALAVAAVAIGLFAGRQAESAASVRELADTLDEQTGAFTANTRAAVVKKLSDDNAYEAAKRAGVSQKELTDAVLEGGNALDSVLKKIGDTNTIATFFDGTGIAAGNASQSIRDLAGEVDNAPGAFNDSKEAMDESTAATDDNSDALDQLAGKAADTVTQVDDLAEAIRGFGSAQLDVNEANREFEAAIDDITETLTAQQEAYIAANGSLDGWTASLDIGTEAGRENQSALDAIAQSALNSAAAILEQTGSQDGATAAVQRGRDELILALAQFGITGAAAEAYADSLGLIPSNINTAASLTGVTAAEAELAQLARERHAIIRVTTTGEAIYGNGPTAFLPQAKGGVVSYFAAGGMRENHVAQMAPAGSWRVWGEPETGGESYIPHAPSKRARSLDIWGETGRILGVPGFAEGGYVSGPSRGSAPYMVAAPQQSGGVFQGNLYLSSGEFLGMVRGELAQADTNQRVSLENGLGR
jgi:TP901 family phage tail tape measure protein